MRLHKRKSSGIRTRVNPRLHGSDEARALHKEAPAIDMHADPLLWNRFVGYDLNKRHSPPLPRAALGGHVDVPRLHEGGVGAMFFGLVALPGMDRKPSRTCEKQLDALYDAAEASNKRLFVATSAEDVQRAHRDGSVAALLGIEGAHSLEGKLETLEHFARRGVRYLGLLHFSANACGAPALGLGSDKSKGLTKFGQDTVKLCEELGVIVDLAHINRKGFFDACTLATKPMIVSHTGLAGVHDIWRNIDDEQLRAVANTGGIAGVIFVPEFLGRDGLDAVVDHLLHIVNVAGEDAPALGSDWDGFVRPIRGLEEVNKLPDLTDAMLARGVKPSVVRKILRENALRVLREVPPRVA